MSSTPVLFTASAGDDLAAHSRLSSPTTPSTTSTTSSANKSSNSNNNKDVRMMHQYHEWLVRMMMILEEETMLSGGGGGFLSKGETIPTTTKQSTNKHRSYLQTSLPSQAEADKGKLTVVLDIDETLIHTMFLPDSMALTPELAKTINDQYSSSLPSRAKHVFCFSLRGRGVIVRKRPMLDEFLLEASKRYELIAFTAGMEEYATIILDHLDPTKQIFRHRLFRQHCSYNGLVKDLRVLNRDLAKTVLVDNSHSSFLFQLCNGIPIESFVDDMSDQALKTLEQLLTNLDRSEMDVRTVLGNIFRLEARLRTDFQAVMQYFAMKNQGGASPTTTSTINSQHLNRFTQQHQDIASSTTIEAGISMTTTATTTRRSFAMEETCTAD